MISQFLLRELKTIIQQDYGIKLTQTAVAEVANSLVGFFELLAKTDCQKPEGNRKNEQPKPNYRI